MQAEDIASLDTQPTLKASLWDMDGTLVDTEPYWIAAEYELVAAHGGQWDAEKSLEMVGKALDDAAVILQGAGVDLSVREIIDYLSTRVISGIRDNFPWRPGAKELLAELHGRGVRCVLVTMSEEPLAREVVNALPHPYFEFLVTGDQVTNGKPHPEPYLTAVERLRVSDPSLTVEHCVAIEDSVPGVASAMAAKVPTIAVPHVVALAEDENRTTWASLAGKSYHDVVAVLARSSAGDAL